MARFAALGMGRLVLGDEELLIGPLPEVEQMAAFLNVLDPADADVAAAVRDCIGRTRGCSFAPGARLLSDGTPLNRLKKP